MGWLDGLFGNRGADSDPLSKLDPKLREFLENESPVKYSTSSNDDKTEAGAAEQDPRPGAGEGKRAAAGAPPGAEDASAVPRESLFQDGRYAHLWKTYRPLSAVEAETKTDSEKLEDILEAFKDRKAQIGKAALENCALEQVDWSDCMKRGDWTARMTMCRAEVRKFERCYTMQSRLLKALGYLSTYDRPPQVEEDIQMHADRLYHRMQEQEAAIEAAQKEGRPAPTFAPLIPRRTPAAGEDDFDVAKMNPEVQKKWRDQLEKLPESERLAEEEAMKGELRAKAELASRVQGLWKEQAKEREVRKAEGKETVSDRLAGVFGRQ